jgi:hypothetical protein
VIINTRGQALSLYRYGLFFENLIDFMPNRLDINTNFVTGMGIECLIQ